MSGKGVNASGAPASAASVAAVAPVADPTPGVHSPTPSSKSKDNKRRTYKVIVIGDSGVGKTCLTFRFCAGHFPGTTEATIGVDFREKVVHVDNEDIRLQLWDTAGQERFRRSMVSHYYRNVCAVVLVYDVTRRISFDSMVHWIRECQEHGLTNSVPMIMVGNKFEDGITPAVTTAEAQRFADDHRMPLFETSAKDDGRSDHVDAIFMTLAHKIKLAGPILATTEDNSGGGVENRTVRPGRRIVYANEAYQEQGGYCCA